MLKKNMVQKTGTRKGSEEHLYGTGVAIATSGVEDLPP